MSVCERKHRIKQRLLLPSFIFFFLLLSVFLRTEIMKAFGLRFCLGQAPWMRGLGASVNASGIEVKNWGQFISLLPLPPTTHSIMCHFKYLLKLGNRSNTGRALQWICHSGGAEPIQVKFLWQSWPPSQEQGFQSWGNHSPCSPSDFFSHFLRCLLPCPSGWIFGLWQKIPTKNKVEPTTSWAWGFVRFWGTWET